MPWKECSVMDERLRFVARLLDGEAMTDVCREFGISRKTGYIDLNPASSAPASPSELLVFRGGFYAGPKVSNAPPSSGESHKPDHRDRTYHRVWR